MLCTCLQPNNRLNSPASQPECLRRHVGRSSCGRVTASRRSRPRPWNGAFPNGLQQRLLAPTIRRRLDSLPKAERPPESVSRAFWGAFSPDHRYFARARGLQLEDAATGQVLGPFHGVHSVAFSPDSQRVVAGSDDRQAVKIWDTQTLQELLTLRGESTFFSQTRFSPDGNLLATMSFSGLLHVWRAPSWAEIEAAERNDALELRADVETHH